MSEYQIQLEPTKGITLPGGRAGEWWHVRYRREGARRWQHFNLEANTLTLEGLHAAIAKHEIRLR